MSVPDEIGRSNYINLTTYRKDGTAVATPVWAVLNGDELVVVTETDTWKVKRIRNNGHVLVTVANIRGKVAPGAASAEGTARLLDAAETETARTLLARKYLLSRVGNWFAKVLRMRRKPLTGIAITF
jgi:PPOX class probable F420-dependent enzyme